MHCAEFHSSYTDFCEFWNPQDAEKEPAAVEAAPEGDTKAVKAYRATCSCDKH